MTPTSPALNSVATGHTPVHELVRAAAARHPERTAIEAEARRLTYTELESRAAGLAGLLLAAGATKGARVAVLAEDPLAVIPAVLAILKAGGVFVPLDPLLPERRLAWMVAEVAPAWLLVEPAFAALAERLAVPPGPRLHLLGEEPAAGAGAPAVAHEPDDPCYVVFTSGSTGIPKGIVGRLKGIDHFVRWEIDALGAGIGTRVSQLTIPIYDAFLRDVFVPLCCGGTVCVPPDRMARLAPGQLVAWLHGGDVHLLHCVPSLFRTLLGERLRPALFPGLRWVLLAGEPLLPADVRRWMDVFGERIELINLYGPSETTLTKLYHRVLPADRERPTIPIGRPIRGAKVAVVDDGGRISPPGVAGEIYIRTPFRSLGYLGRPDLTREVFVPNPLGNDPEDIVYKTGDLGRVRDDGAIEFLGRRDHQVKVRGVRVEPAEIESALREHERVLDAVVVAREEGESGCRLCAYVVTDGELAAAALRGFLAGSLPDAMIPATFVHLDRLPRTPTGKVDRGALPPPSEEPRRFVAPATPTEELLAVLWQGVLGREGVGREDNFFALGGHSLLALRLLARMRESFGVEVTLESFLRRQSLAALGAAVDELQRTGADSEVPPLNPVPREGDIPLSFAQQRLWFLDRLSPGQPAYNMASAVGLSGPLDARALATALTRLAARHEALRTIFVERHGWPVQHIVPPLPFPLRRVDLAALATPVRDQEAERLGTAELRAPFDLTRGPLLRGLLLQRAAAEHDLILTGHHIVLDNWSVGVLVRDLNALYREAATGEPAGLPALPVQYADFAVWQRAWLRDRVLEEQLAYWREHLRDAPVLELPGDRPRPPVLGMRGARATALMPTSLAAGLAELGRQEGLTLFMVLLAAFAALLQRYAGQDDLVVGTPVANRSRSETEHMVGFLVNTLALRLDLSGDPGLRQLAVRARQVALGAYSHQDLPFEKLVEELQPRRDPSRQPLFQMMLVFQHVAGSPQLDLPGLAARPLASEVPRANFDLTLGIIGGGRGLPAVLDYNVELFEAVTARHLLGRLEELLAGAVASPDTPLSQLPLLSAAERHQLLHEWQGERLEVRPETTIHGLFGARAALAPDRIALVCNAEAVTYGELGRRTRALARRLRALGVGRDHVVGLCIERSPRLVVGLLGILEAGAAYLPLDSELPRERLTWMLEDARATAIVAEEGTRGAVAASARRALFLDSHLDGEPAAGTALSAAGASADVAADDLAYVLYTSGSSGQPKGVMVPHGGVCATLLWRLAAFGLGPDDRVLQNIPFTFDPSVWQIFGALLAGARSILVPPGRHQDTAYLDCTMRDEGVTIADFPPSFLQVLIEGRILAGSAALRCLFVGGEAFPPDLKDRGVAALSGALYNIYGPTEACIDIACWDCRREPGGQRVPIGRPIAGKRVFLLDAALAPLPIGIPGELYVAGDGLARGYLGRADQTAKAFVPDPFAAAPGARLYRTGDLARLRSDGVLEFLGRTDRQVKVHGLRIELGEIEALLGRHPQVLEAAVVVREDAGGARLVGYFTPRGDSPEPAALSSFLRRKLPAYMVPGAFVELAALPVTANGKVDREALPAPAAPAERGAGYEAPRTALERSLTAIWQDVLQLDLVGVDDNFFDLGGHSLAMIRVHGRLAEALDREVPIVDLFTYPSIRSLARHLAGAAGEAALDAEEERAGRQLAAHRRQKDKLKARRGPEVPR